MVISTWHWVAFVACIVVFLALDLGVFHRRAHVVEFREALGWTSVWFTLAMLFGLLIAPQMVTEWSRKNTIEFITGYLIEFSLSMDNVFVIALIFAYFRVPAQYQHRVLFWGILGALVMRGVMIWIGVGLIRKFDWLLAVLGAFLVVSGVKMLWQAEQEEELHPEKNLAIRLARKLFPVCSGFVGQKFVTRWNGRRALTPLALVLLMVETTDLIFAVDSIPAIFSVTTNPFIVFTSNVFAILGLRSLYFVLAGAIRYFRFLKVGLSVVLVFIGVKMMIAEWVHIPVTVSLSVVVSILIASILYSVLAARRARNKPA